MVQVLAYLDAGAGFGMISLAIVSVFLIWLANWIDTVGTVNRMHLNPLDKAVLAFGAAAGYVGIIIVFYKALSS